MPEKPKRAKPAKPKPTGSAKAKPKDAAVADEFLSAFAALLRRRKIPVPPGLLDATPDAYGRQPAVVVEQLEKLDDRTLVDQAARIAGHARRQVERAAAEWERSPLVAEIRRRRLPEPARPTRVVGVALSMKKPLSEWSDRELVETATEWSMRAGGRPAARGR